MKIIDNSKSVWYEKYKPACIDDLIIPEEIKSKLKADVASQDIANIGLFSSNPGCLLPGTNIEVQKEPNILSFSESKEKYNLTNFEINKLRKYLGTKEIDDNLITNKILELVKLKGSISKSAGKLWSLDKTKTDKHLKLSHWMYKYPVEKAISETKRINKMKQFFDIDLNDTRFINFKQENKLDSLLKIKFKIIYSNANKITDLFPGYDKQYTKEYWIVRGWTEDEAIKNIKSIQSNNMNNRIKKFT